MRKTFHTRQNKREGSQGANQHLHQYEIAYHLSHLDIPPQKIDNMLQAWQSNHESGNTGTRPQGSTWNHHQGQGT